MATEVLFASPGGLSLSTAQKLSPAESLAVVDIFMNAAIACVCHTRELIPWDSDCFRTRYIDDLGSDFWKNGPNKYAAFCDAEPSVPSIQSQEFRILKRGEDKRADGILDLIETGVFAAVEGGFLEAVKFFITQGGPDCDTSDVLESYTLNFSYDTGASGDRGIRSISFNSSQTFTTSNAIKSFKKVIKSLLASLQGLPLLPRRRSLGVAMLYNNRCPIENSATGFLTEDIPSMTAEQSDWHKLLLQKCGTAGNFEVGPYSVLVGSSNIKPFVKPTTSSQMRDLRTSRQLQSLQKSSSQQQSGLVPTEDDPGSEDLDNTPSTISLLSDVCSPLQSSNLKPRSSSEQAFQHSSGHQSPRKTVMTVRNRKRNIIPEKMAELIVQACGIEANNSGDHVFNVADLQHNNIVRLKPGTDIGCECGDESTHEDLLRCLLCGASQHVECYGWKGFAQVRRPDDHFCYACLLLPQERDINAQMPAVVHKRLGLSYLQVNSPAKVVDLMHAMHLSQFVDGDHRIFNTIIDELQREGYLKRSKSAIKSTINKETASLALREYLNPLARISHQFTAVKDGENATIRAKAIAAAVRQYTRGQAYLPGDDDVQYSQQVVEDAFGEIAQRWGFYDEEPSRKRKATTPAVEETPPSKRAAPPQARSITTPPPHQTALARKASFHEGTPPIDAMLARRVSSVKRKASRCEALVSLDRSSPSTVYSLDEALAEGVRVATSEVQWAKYGNRRGCGGR